MTEANTAAADIPLPAKPTLADQVAAIDAIEVAARIVAKQGTRAAIGASTVEIVALAKRCLTLTTLADLTYDMLITSDRVAVARNDQERDAQRAIRAAVSEKIELIGASLEALGYRHEQPPQQTEKIDGQG